MQVGVVLANDTWHFFDDIFRDFQSRYTVEVFRRRQVNAPFFHTRINRSVFRHDLQTFLESQDVVFFEWASEFFIAATRLPKRTPMIVRLHRYEMFQHADAVNWDNVDRIILVSEAMRQKFITRFPHTAEKTVVISAGVDIQKFHPTPKPFGGDLGMLCSLIPRKRVYELILAFDTLSQKRQGFRLHIAGESKDAGDYEDALHSLAKKLNLEDRVKFYGKVKDPWNWFQNIDIYISNSYSEGLQVAPMEAMACGRYCLSHHWDGAEELLPADHLFLTEAQLIEKIEAYADLTDAEKQGSQAEMRQIACENFDSGRINQQIRAVVEQAAGLKRKPA